MHHRRQRKPRHRPALSVGRGLRRTSRGTIPQHDRRVTGLAGPGAPCRARCDGGPAVPPPRPEGRRGGGKSPRGAAAVAAAAAAQSWSDTWRLGPRPHSHTVPRPPPSTSPLLRRIRPGPTHLTTWVLGAPRSPCMSEPSLAQSRGFPRAQLALPTPPAARRRAARGSEIRRAARLARQCSRAFRPLVAAVAASPATEHAAPAPCFRLPTRMGCRACRRARMHP